MRTTVGRTIAALVCISMTCLFISRVAAQDDKKAGGQPSADQMKQMQDMMKAIQPGPEHEKLKEMVGTWDADVKFFPPEAPGTVQESKGTAKMEMILGGRYLQQTFDGSMAMGGQNMPFHGMGITGYDNAEKKLISIWIDDMGTGILVTKGTCDDHVMTLEGDMMDPMSKQMMKVKEVGTMVDKDHQKFEMFMSGPKGDMPKVMEIMYTRKS